MEVKAIKCTSAGALTSSLLLQHNPLTDDNNIERERDTMTTLELGHKARVALQHGANSRPALLYRRIVRYVW